MERVLVRGLRRRDELAHGVEDRNLRAVEDLALEEPQDLEAVLLGGNEVGEQGQQLVVEADELVPDLDAGPQALLVGP